MSLTVATFYRFVTLDDLPALKAELAALCADTGTRGTILIAPEGINGTLAGPRDGVATMVAHLDRRCGIGRGELKFSAAEDWPFARTKVRIRPEIITMRAPEADPSRRVGTYVAPSDWNALIDDPDTIVIDTRNDYEVSIGSFAGSINPMTGTFRDFPEWFARERERLLGSGNPPRVAMFCTGGIRCEKASAFLKKEGLDDVFHLKGGILAYLEQMPEEESRWQGECFVFDQRVAVGHALSAGTHDLCFACRRPVSPSDKQSAFYEAGVSCAACHDERDDAQRASYRERHKQEMLAAQQGRTHVGAVFAPSGDDDGD